MPTLELHSAFRCPGTDNRKGLSQHYYFTSTFYLFEGDRPGKDTLFRHTIGIARDAVRIPSLDHAWQLMPPKRMKKLYRQEKYDIQRVAGLHGIEVDVDEVMSDMEDMVNEVLVAARQRCIAANYIESDYDWWPDRHGPLIREIGVPEAKPAFAA